MPCRNAVRSLAAVLVLSLATACGLPAGPTDNGEASPTSPGGANTPETAQPLQVHGLVVGADDGQPLDHPVSVVINGGAPISTDAASRFHVTGVTSPYDVTVVDVSGRGVAITYLQVTRPDPTLMLPYTSRSEYHQAAVSGSVEGGLPEDTFNLRTAVLLDLPEALWPRRTSAGAGGGYALNFDWVGEATLTSRLAALQYVRGANGLPASFDYAAQRELSVSDGELLEDVRLELVPLSAGEPISGTISFPEGQTFAHSTYELTFGTSRLEFTDSSRTAEFSYPVPAMEGFEPVVTVLSSGEWGQTTAYLKPPPSHRSGLSIDLLAPPELLLPENASEVDHTTEFSWTPFEEGVHVFAVEPSELYQGEGPISFVVTMDSTAHLPDLAAHGISLAPRVNYVWWAAGISPMASMDAATTPAFVRQWNRLVDASYQAGFSSRRALKAR